jgi:hypothetical protein
MSYGTARLDIWNREALGNPANGSAYFNAENPHHQIDTGMTAAHITDKTTHAVSSLVKTQGRVGIAVPVIYQSPTLCSTATNAHSKRLRDLQDGDIFLDPGNIRLR